MTNTVKKRSKIRQFIFGITAIGLAICLCIVCFEIFFRITYFQPRGRVVVPYEFQLSEIEGVPYELTPNHSYQWKYGARRLFDSGFSIPVQINSQGYRDKEIIEPKPDNSYRILAVGDSFTWGLGVRSEDSWVKQLEKLLNHENTDSALIQNKHVEIINTGVGSWNTEIELAYLKKKGLKHAPDAVILGFLTNDFRSGNTEYNIDKRGFLVTRQEGKSHLHLQSLLYEEKPSDNFIKRMIESSHAIRWASGRRMKTEKRQLMAFNDKTSHKKTLQALEGIFNETKQLGIPLYVCIFPYVENVIPESEQADLDVVARHCKSLKIPYLHMEKALSGFTASNLWVHPKDHHPNAIAHNQYAKLIVKHFFSSNVLTN
ncbi:hypothetical protein K8T06_00585 [bacterium]|nr:hypothetical protein [bacterium]